MKRILCAVALLAVGGSVAANPGKTHEYMLDNGMKVIVKEDHRAPIMVSQVWYKVGASYERSGTTGVSHALEHMMFKGTEKHPPGEFSRIIAANGGEENAFTGQDYTAYYQTMSADRLEVSLELEADRMRNVQVPDDEFKKEIEVVMEERRLRTEDKPESLVYEKFLATAYEASPYRSPVIGWMSDLKAMTAGDLRSWYRRWYAPNNATLVVVGDVNPDAVLELAKKHFGPLKPESIEPPKPREEPEQRGLKRVAVKAPARQPYLIMGYKTPVVGTAEQDWEPYALEMLAYVLDGGSSARLTKELIRGSQIAVSASADYNAFGRLPGMLMLDGNPNADKTTADVEAALKEQIEKLRTELIDEQELTRVQAQLIAAKVYEKDSVFYQAMQIGALETVGRDWRLSEQYVDNLQAVTAEQVREVARKYLTDDNLTIGVLEPLPMENKTANNGAAAGGRHGG